MAQQTEALDQGQTTAEALAALAETLRGSGPARAGAAEIGGAADALSASIQELSGAAAQILAAIDQISRGLALQSAAARQSAAAMVEIERAAAGARTGADQALAQVLGLAGTLHESRATLEGLADGVGQALDGMRASSTASARSRPAPGGSRRSWRASPSWRCRSACWR